MPRGPLDGLSFRVAGDQSTLRFAGDLLHLLGADVDEVLTQAGPGPTPAEQWARSGAMTLTGDPDGPELAGPPDVPARMTAAALVVRLLAKRHPQLGRDLDLDGPQLFGERAAIAHLQRQGQTSVGGASRLIKAADRWVAVSLARPTDFELLPAWIGEPLDHRDPWATVSEWVRAQPAALVVASGQLLGIPVATARLTRDGEASAPWAIASSRTGERAYHRPVVVDLSSLWAGPLCGRLLAAAGGRVIKVESTSRPDGARRGPPAFFELLNGAKESVVLDLDSPAGREQLRALIDTADVVIESARPRVMRQWGIDVERLVGEHPHLVWVSITGYGRTGPRSNWVAFGDDAAAAGGLLAIGSDGEPRFCADAAADPATGLHAAVVALAALLGGGSHLIDIALSGVAAYVVGADR